MLLAYKRCSEGVLLRNIFFHTFRRCDGVLLIPAFNMHALEVRRTTASLCKNRKQNMLSFVKDVLIRITLHEDKKKKSNLSQEEYDFNLLK